MMFVDDVCCQLVGLCDCIVYGYDFGDVVCWYLQDGLVGVGGELGWVLLGQLVLEFEQVMNQFKLGEVLQFVQSQFGVYLIQVEGCCEVEVLGDCECDYVCLVICEKKVQVVYEDWLCELCDLVYVEYCVNCQQ